MNTLTTTALKVTCAVIFSISTSGILPATAHAIKPTSLPANTAEHRNANAYVNGTKDDQVVVVEQPIVSTTEVLQTSTAPSQNGIVTTSAPLKAVTVEAAKSNNPSGNNGFIKVNEQEMPDSIPNNDPHVSCNLKVEFYNYDQNPNYRANVSFALQNPTVKSGQTMTVSGDTNPFIGEDSAGGGNDLDAVKSYKLAFTGAPHAKQGYHVKLTIHADGSRGANVKHKVFWVKPCAQPGQGGSVIPSETSVTPGKTLSTSTKSAGNVLPASLPSTGSNYLSFVVTFIASLMTYLSAMIFQLFRIRSL